MENNIDLNIEPSYRGKIRDLYDVEGGIVIVTSDRISLFDVVLNDTINDKGKVLTKISNFWFDFFKDIPNHIIETEIEKFPEPFNKKGDKIDGRAIFVKKLNRVDFECVVRGYLLGSGWKDYQERGSVGGHKLPEGIKLAEKLSEPIFTPATKADSGHDKNVSVAYMEQEIGRKLTRKIGAISKDIFKRASDFLEEKGIILVDTKFEFGFDDAGKIFLIDEVLTPDSSRFFKKDEYEEGVILPSFDKQIIRDYIESTGWDKKSESPSLPQDIVDKTAKIYKEFEELICC